METTVYCDKKKRTTLLKNLVYNERTKHIELDYHFTRKKKIEEGLIKL